MITLFIDTTSREKTSIGLDVHGEKFQLEEMGSRKNQSVLPMIMQILQEHSLSFKEITSIEVNPGPGSFTGIRVGLSIAHALSYALNIPVNGKVVSNGTQLVEPKYS